MEPRHFRNVLGHFPTGVCVVTALEADGTPVGMAVGSFTSVSLDPPLVAFLPDRSSSTFPRIREASSFCVNVLAADQEHVCRTFASKGRDKFAAIPWHPAPSGAPILEGAVAWIDCAPEAMHEAGDHFIYLGRVTHLEVQNPTLPLLFFQGGYGAFSLGSLVMGADSALTHEIAIADRARVALEALAEATNTEVQAFARHGEDFVLVAAASPEGSTTTAPFRLGIHLPFAPPAGRIFVAWSDPEDIERWYDRSPEPLDTATRSVLDRQLASVRRHGWTPAHYSDRLDDVVETIDRIGQVGQTPHLVRHLTQAMTQLERHSDPADLTDATAGTVQALIAPVFHADGTVALMLTLVGIPRGATLERIHDLRDRLLDTADAVSANLGGRRPAA